MSLSPSEQRRALATAVAAARAAGAVMRRNLRLPKRVNESSQHDIKLELDVRCQKLIERRLLADFPGVAILGEEGIVGDPESAVRWVVDPIDGTVNFTYGIPHACVSIALQRRGPRRRPAGARAGGRPGARGRVSSSSEEFQTVVGVVYDPFCDEIWTAIAGGPARLNGRVIRACQRGRLAESIVAIGFAKEVATMNRMLPALNTLIRRVRKIRIMGAAALSLVYVGTGRMDAYLEFGLRLWDIAAGGLIIECAGGSFLRKPAGPDYRYQILASSQGLARPLQRLSGIGIKA